MARKRTKKEGMSAGMKRLLGFVCALAVLSAALLGTQGGKFFTLDAGAEGQPSLEHYVNRQGEARDGSVHVDLETGTETFAFDLQAYIPADAKGLVITERLNNWFRFVGAESNYRAQIKDADETGRAPALSAIDYAYAVPANALQVQVEKQDNEEFLTVTLDLTGLSDDERANIQGKWLQFGFDVRIREEYTVNDAVLRAVCETYQGNANLVVSDAPVDDSTGGAHQGLTAQAGYQVIYDGNVSADVFSNIVTIAVEQAEALPQQVQTNSLQTKSLQGVNQMATLQTQTGSATGNNASGNEGSEGTEATGATGNNGTATTGTGNNTTGTGSGNSAGSAGTDDDTVQSLSATGSSTSGDPAQDFEVSGLLSFENVPEGQTPGNLTLTLFANNEERASFNLSFNFSDVSVASLIKGETGPGCTVTPTAERSAWSYTISKLDENDADGNPITYTIQETARPNGYLVSYEGNGQQADNTNNYKIINTWSEDQAKEDAANAPAEEEEEKKEETTALGDSAIHLFINGESKDVLLDQRDDRFFYTIEATVPKGAKTVTISDTLDPVLLLYTKSSDIVVTAGGNTIPTSGNVNGTQIQTITLDGQVLTVRVPEAEKYEEQTVSVRFDSIIRSDMDLSVFAEKNGSIPNTAKMTVTDEDDKAVEKTSETLYVKMPEDPGVKKTVNDTDNYVLEDETDALSYTITARIPLDAVTYTLVDSVSQVIEIKNASATINGASVPTADLSTRGQEVSFKMNDAYNYAGQMVTMVVNARIVEGADLSLFNNYKVPNTVSIFVNGRLYETSAPATVDGEVLGVRTRGGQTGEGRLIVHIVIVAAALSALVFLLRKRIDF